MDTLAIDQVIPVGLVPKYVAVTHDGAKVLVSNWCSWDLTVIDVATAKVVASVPWAAPRGIAVSPDSSTAYVTIMGGSTLAQVDLGSNSVVRSIQVGANPRHVVLDPAGTTAYVSLNSGGQVVKVDLGSSSIAGRAGTGQLARSLAISTDGLSLYVVNYGSASVTKLRASGMTELQTVPTGVNHRGHLRPADGQRLGGDLRRPARGVRRHLSPLTPARPAGSQVKRAERGEPAFDATAKGGSPRQAGRTT